MKQKSTYVILTSFIAVVLAFILISNQQNKNKTVLAADLLELLPRKAGLMQSAEWVTAKENATTLLQKIKQNPADKKSFLLLIALYLQEARISGNFEYYNTAAMNCVHEVLKLETQNFEALTFKAMILLSQHHFAEGFKVAEQARNINPYNSFVYGLLVDASVELGKYDEAVNFADKMVSIRPDSRSYARIAYLREIHGDITGAIEAMKLAIQAGSPGDENTEWCTTQLGKLYEKKGDVANAQFQYQTALSNRPNYPYALAGLARIATAKKDYNTALNYYIQADTLLSDHTFKEGMIEIYTLTGRVKEAEAMAETILKQIQVFEKNNTEGEGQNETHEMAHAYIGVGNFDEALKHALTEYNNRPSNIEVNETVALVYYQKKDYSNALKHIQTALKTNCKNPELLCHAGLIYAKAGDTKTAKIFLLNALRHNPLLPAELEKESRNVLKAIS